MLTEFRMLPKIVQKQMLEEQVKQGNTENPEVFDKKLTSCRKELGFDWKMSAQRYYYWKNLLKNKVLSNTNILFVDRLIYSTRHGTLDYIAGEDGVLYITQYKYGGEKLWEIVYESGNIKEEQSNNQAVCYTFGERLGFNKLNKQ